MPSVGFNRNFPVGDGDFYWPPTAAEAPDEPGTPPLGAMPQAWEPAPVLAWNVDPAVLDLSFTEPASWSRGPWHVPASSSGYYVPRFLEPSNRAWIGAGPVEWSLSIDGTFREANIQAGRPGSRTTLHVSAATPNVASGQPLDWAWPHTFRLHLLYQDVPEYQWWAWDGSYGLAPKGTDVQHYYFFPQDRFRATSFYDGYPSGEPMQPVLPFGRSSWDYGGLGPIQVPGEHLTEGGRFAGALAFTLNQQAGTYLEVISDPYTLTAPPPRPQIIQGVAGRTVTIIGDTVVGGTLRAVLS